MSCSLQPIVDQDATKRSDSIPRRDPLREKEVLALPVARSTTRYESLRGWSSRNDVVEYRTSSDEERKGAEKEGDEREDAVRKHS